MSELHSFAAVGLEIEYMIVDAETLEVCPEADRAMLALDPTADLEAGELERGPAAWSNELARHVIELKGARPFEGVDAAQAAFTPALAELGAALARRGRALLPTAMHPTMNPRSQTHLWPFGDDVIYRTFDRIFGCQGHGWSNLQSMHVNLPFSGDEELAQLHAAVRVVLPILPAIAASSPFVEGRTTGRMDNRLRYYANNARRIPSVSGAVIPEPVFDRATYHLEILERIYADLAPHDPQGVLRHEWANARGAIVRFDRSAIELRVIDTQEHLAGDLAVAEAAIRVARDLVERGTFEATARLSVEQLAEILWDCVRDADLAAIDDLDVLEALGLPRRRRLARDLWRDLLERVGGVGGGARDAAMQVILQEGALARRLVRALGPAPRPERIREVYREIAACLAQGRPFLA